MSVSAHGSIRSLPDEALAKSGPRLCRTTASCSLRDLSSEELATSQKTLFSAAAFVREQEEAPVLPCSNFSKKGRFGWTGGFGTCAYTDPVERVIGILFTQRMLDSPESPKVFTDFWTLAYGALA